MIAEALEAGVKTFRRRRALEPYWLRIQEALSRQSRDDTSSSKVSVDGIALLIEPWVAARVDMHGADVDCDPDQIELLRHSLALWLKSAIDVTGLRRCVQSGSGNLYALQAELMLDCSFGAALLPEFQDVVDSLVHKGQMEEARRFSKFQHQSRFVVQEIQQAIADSNGFVVELAPSAPAAKLTRAVAAPPPPQRTMESLLREADMEQAVPRRRQRSAAPKSSAEPAEARSKWRPTTMLIVLDAIALAVWLVIMARSEIHSVAPRALDRNDFPSSVPLKELVVRPPAVYASVDQQTWNALDEAEKMSFVKGMGSTLLTSGYGGLLLKSTDGRIVGTWLQNGGARLFATVPAIAIAEGPMETPPDSSAPPAQYTRFVP